jgi:cyclase
VVASSRASTFVELRDAGDPVEIAARYNDQGADELTFLDITATSDGRDLILHIIEAVASQVFIPPDGRRRGAHRRGRAPPAQCGRRQDQLQLGRDRQPAGHRAMPRPNMAPSASWWPSTPSAASGDDLLDRGEGWDVYSHGGRKNTGLDAVAWARQMADFGAGEILLTSMDRDGTKAGFDLELTRAVSDAVDMPVIASGGVGTLDHLADGIQTGGADAVLAASIFHYGEFTVGRPRSAWPARHPGAALTRPLPSALIAAPITDNTPMNWLDEVKWDAQGWCP